MKLSNKMNFCVSYLTKKKEKKKKRQTNVKLIYIFPFSLEKEVPKCFVFNRVVIFRLKRYDNTRMRVFEVRRRTRWIANVETS